MNKIFFLFFIIFLEGYVVLSAELIAIRLTVPFVGSGTDTVSIIIAAVLMPLAVGYYIGGQYKKNKNQSVRKKLLRNIFISSIFFLIGLSHVLIEVFFETLSDFGVTNRLLQITIYSLTFLVIPVFLLAQTIPLVSHYFRKEELSQITGKMLFFSTTGSFMGAVFSTLVLMAFIGVHNAAVITIACLTILYLMLSRKIFTLMPFVMICVTLTAYAFNNNSVMRALNIIENNQYNMIKVTEKNNGVTRRLSLNNNNSSLYSEVPITFGDDPTPRHTFLYVDHINKNLIDPTMFEDRAFDILVIGAAGFTIGLSDDKNNYTFIDIDKSVKKISEEDFLKQKLTENKKFEATPARAFIHKAKKEGKKYDLIILDTFVSNKSIPEHLATQEFFLSVREILKPNSIMAGNFIVSANFSSAFSVKIDNTLRRVFPNLNRQIVSGYDAWNTDNKNTSNIIYIYHHRKNTPKEFYSDDKNTIYYDKNKRIE